MMTQRSRSAWLLVFSLLCLACAAVLLLLVVVGCTEQGTAVSPLPTATRAGVIITETRAAVLPLAYNCNCDCPTPVITPTVTPPPITTTVEILDCEGSVATVDWLRFYFGDVTWTDAPTNTAHLARLLASCGDAPAVLMAHVADTSGQPVEGATVVLWWDDAPMLPLELRACGLDRGVYGPTNGNGDVGFGLGGGSYYWPPDGGPHRMWIGGVGGTACLAGLGMLAETNHHHLDSHWRLSSAAIAGLGDWGFSEGSVVYPVERDGETMWVIQVP